MRNHIKRRRGIMNLTQKELADMLGVQKSAVTRWEAGTYDPSPAQMQDLAIALQTSMSLLFPEYEPENLRKKQAISTLGTLRRIAHIKVGEKMVVRLHSVDGCGTNTFVTGTVVETSARWFRIRIDKHGYSTCVHYQAFLSENNVRRATK